MNVKITGRGTKRYASAVRLATIALIISIVLMMANKFFVLKNEHIKVKLVTLLK
ncbi:MAG: hypothetical protein ABI091_13945 [Ferruginibacter sp.]